MAELIKAAASAAGLAHRLAGGDLLVKVVIKVAQSGVDSFVGRG